MISVVRMSRSMPIGFTLEAMEHWGGHWNFRLHLGRKEWYVHVKRRGQGNGREDTEHVGRGEELS